MLFSNKTYDFLKAIVQIGLPAAGTLYFTLASIWGLPNAEQVVGTLAAVATFLGVLIAIGSRAYSKSDARFDGNIVIGETDETKTYSLELNRNPEELDSLKEAVFKINPEH